MGIKSLVHPWGEKYERDNIENGMTLALERGEDEFIWHMIFLFPPLYKFPIPTSSSPFVYLIKR